MTNPQINIASLDFNDIKNSLKSYLNTKSDIFGGYDFNGSAFNHLLDVFAYNTLYYAFYANMIANESFLDTAKIENNIISLVKPLGYLVPGKSAAQLSATVTATSPQTILAYTDFFSGSNSSGQSFRFYPIENKSVNVSPTQITAYEARSVIKDLTVSVDLDEQKVFLANTEIDINTITVKVNGTTWTKYETFSADPGPDSEVYFLDRTSAGFYLVFGKKTLNDFQSSYGKNITASDIVTVSYLVPTGLAANGVSTVANTKTTVTSVVPSSGGRDVPDLDLIRFFAPKFFAANDRAVTKDDYYGVLLASNTLPTDISKKEQISVWGGEDADPPAYGRVFVSFANSNYNPTNSQIKRSISFLKNKCVVGILPEYIQAQPITAVLTIKTNALSENIDSIQTAIQNYYNTNIMNNSILSIDISNLISKQFNNALIEIDSVQVSVNVTGGFASGKYIFFRNALLPLNQRGSVLTTTTFTNKSGVLISLVDDPTFNNGIATNGILVDSARPDNTYGIINYTSGYIFLDGNKIPNGSNLTVTIKAFLDKNNIQIKNEMLLNNITAIVTKV